MKNQSLPRSARIDRSSPGVASREPFLRTVAFRPLQRSTPESARKQPEGCGPHGFRFKGHVHGPEAKKASHEPDGRASLSPASRVGRVPRTSSGSPGRTRPTGDRFKGRVPGSETKGTSHEPDGRASLSPASRVGRVPRMSSGSPGRTRPTSDGFMGCEPGSETKGTSHE
ncbi:MAG: hypothetical protein FJ398_27465, partial [Verrucomicrobia bacterium]|nr:hypothetical protein [Verrucomicrobiota bacterium]